METTGLTLHVIVKGRVQGVGYRHYATVVARRLNVDGWVRNLPGGDVEVLARLPSPAVRGRFLAALQEGPPAGHVDALDVQPAAPGLRPEGVGFRVRY